MTSAPVYTVKQDGINCRVNPAYLLCHFWKFADVRTGLTDRIHSMYPYNTLVDHQIRHTAMVVIAMMKVLHTIPLMSVFSSVTAAGAVILDDIAGSALEIATIAIAIHRVSMQENVATASNCSHC